MEPLLLCLEVGMRYHCCLQQLTNFPQVWVKRPQLTPAFCCRNPWYQRHSGMSETNSPNLRVGSGRVLVQRAAASVTMSSLHALICALEQAPMLLVPTMMTMAWGMWSWIWNISRRWCWTSSIFKSASKWYSNCWNTLSSGYLCRLRKNFGIKCCKCWSPSNHTASVSVIIQDEYIFGRHWTTTCHAAW